MELIHKFEKVSSKAFDVQQMESASRGDRAHCRLVLAHLGDLTSEFYENAKTAFTSNMYWQAFGEQCYTQCNQSLAFSMISSSVCGIAQLLDFRYDQFPFRLWSLLDNTRDARLVAAEILRCKLCMMDNFTKAFVKHFQQRAALGLTQKRVSSHFFKSDYWPGLTLHVWSAEMLGSEKKPPKITVGGNMSCT